ncbi:GNAT family N-acetyltransferase [Aliikangiella marina]|uniref:GNAT family N-acetyltransferase n=1 Tax=Aliikangiella marina TaxID=1712262 RepID=A0A545TJY7_9GAMM|nr:GNAT family N-acetyltransferase [Aliikangiella marina]
MEIREVTNISSMREPLNEVLIDCVDNGASIGFLPPLSEVDAGHYWAGVNADLQDQNRIMLIALDNRRIVGCVQLALVSKPNGDHRCDVEKLMVHTAARGKGIGQLLMKALEEKAKSLHRKLLVLDTRLGDAASHLYRKLGFLEAGQIPDFAKNEKGGLDPTVFFYKKL